MTALMVASQQGHREVVEVLVGKGARIDVQMENGRTALMLASALGHREVVEVLVGKGARIDLQGEDGMTALALAKAQGHREVVALLQMRLGGKASGSAPGPARVGRNDPCPCGSGKKYKKCCG